jgi:Family of unknown function (DUF6498)
VIARLIRVAETLGVNSLPFVGLVAGDWSWSTALGVYWFENLIAAALVALRLVLHQRWRAALDERLPKEVKTPGQFFATTLAFNLAHGLFLGMVLLLVLKATPDVAALEQAFFVLLVMQGLAFGFDLWSLDQWPVARVAERAGHLLGRVVLVHLSLIAGMITFAIFDEAWTFFAVFAGLKGLSDVAQFLPRARAVSA